MKSEYVSLAEAARRLGLAQVTLRLQAERGRLKAEKIGRNWAVTTQEVERYRQEVLRVTSGQPRRERGVRDGSAPSLRGQQAR